MAHSGFATGQAESPNASVSRKDSPVVETQIAGGLLAISYQGKEKWKYQTLALPLQQDRILPLKAAVSSGWTAITFRPAAEAVMVNKWSLYYSSFLFFIFWPLG